MKCRPRRSLSFSKENGLGGRRPGASEPKNQELARSRTEYAINSVGSTDNLACRIGAGNFPSLCLFFNFPIPCISPFTMRNQAASQVNRPTVGVCEANNLEGVEVTHDMNHQSGPGHVRSSVVGSRKDDDGALCPSKKDSSFKAAPNQMRISVVRARLTVLSQECIQSSTTPQRRKKLWPSFPFVNLHHNSFLTDGRNHKVEVDKASVERAQGQVRESAPGQSVTAWPTGRMGAP